MAEILSVSHFTEGTFVEIVYQKQSFDIQYMLKDDPVNIFKIMLIKEPFVYFGCLYAENELREKPDQ